MYTIDGITYAEAGKVLVSDKFIGFSVASDSTDLSERYIDISELTAGEYILFDRMRWLNPGIHTYADAKKFVIGKRYSNDDQIAIILNKDNSEEDALAYEKMQE